MRSSCSINTSRYRVEGDTAFEPARTATLEPTDHPSATVELIVALYDELVLHGLDAGANTIAWHLATRHRVTVSTATVYRILRRAGLTNDEPKKRPRSS